MKRPDAVEQPNLPQALAAADGRQEDSPSSHRATPDIYRPEKSIENRSKLSAQSVPPQTREQEIPNKSIENRSPGIAPPVPVQTREQIVPKPIEPPKPVELPKPRRVRIWDSEITETRDALISTAGFADLYTMRADIRLRQEQLRAKGLLKEELALNDLVSRVNDALEKKKRAENLE